MRWQDTPKGRTKIPHPETLEFAGYQTRFTIAPPKGGWDHVRFIPKKHRKDLAAMIRDRAHVPGMMVKIERARSKMLLRAYYQGILAGYADILRMLR